VLSIESSDAQLLRMRSWATDADLTRALAAWRDDQAYAYALWSQQLEATRQVDGWQLRRRAGASALQAPAQLPRWHEYQVPASRYRCQHGWLVFNGEAEPQAEQLDRAEISVTRAADGGLVATWRYRRARSFSLWCGDGCKPDWPLPDEHLQGWWHAPPTAPVVDAPLEWAALVAADPRPVAQRTRYADGTVLRYADAPARPTPTPAPATPASPMLVLGIDRPDRAAAAHEVAAPAVAPAADAAHAAAEQRWRERIEPVLPAGSLIHALRCDARACFFEGRAHAMSDVSTLLRALDQAHGTTPELLLIERVDDGRYRFELRLAAQP
jgi:hypothetical protein